MPAKPQLKDLSERRRLLLLEADLNRSIIRLECDNIRKRFAGITAARERIKAGGPWMVAGGTVASVLALRHWRKVLRWAPTALAAMRWAKSLKRR